MTTNWNLNQLKDCVWTQCTEMASQAKAAALKCTELTGRETTAAEVKQAAVVVGAVALGLGTLAALANSRRGLLGNVVSGATSGSTTVGWGDDFESQAVRGRCPRHS